MIQDKRIFSSAPKENLDAIPDRKARFRGAHIVGRAIEGIAILLFLGAAVLAAWDGIRNGFGYFRRKYLRIRLQGPTTLAGPLQR